MSERFEDDDPTGRIFRAGLTGASGIPRRDPLPDSQLFAPGRAWLELSILAAALAIVLPVLSTVALLGALGARARGNRRWLAAALAAIWCGFLGVAVRSHLGMGLVP